MRYLILGDSHINDTVPVNRKDDFLNVQFKKLAEIGKIKKKEKCDGGIIHVGDLFNYWKTSYATTGRVIRCLIEHDMHITGVLGSHDLQGYNLQSKNDSAIGLTEKAGVFTECRGEGELENGTIYARYIHAKLKHELQEFDCRDEKRFSIVVAHAMITDKEGLPFEHIPYKQLDGFANIIISGHFHTQWIIQTDKTLFINPGPMLRTSVTNTYTPSVVVLDISEGCVNECYAVELKSAKPYSEVFREVAEIEDVINVPKFDIEKVEAVNLIDKIALFGKDKKEDPIIIAKAIECVNIAQKSIQEI